MLFEPVWQNGTSGSTQPRNRVSREVGKRHESKQGLLVVVAIILIGVRHRAGDYLEAGQGY